jgi:hypothetical protein
MPATAARQASCPDVGGWRSDMERGDCLLAPSALTGSVYQSPSIPTHVLTTPNGRFWQLWAPAGGLVATVFITARVGETLRLYPTTVVSLRSRAR